jgi:hypothetical protein
MRQTVKKYLPRLVRAKEAKIKLPMIRQPLP